MHVALIIDEDRLREARETLDRLVAGLTEQELRCTVLSPAIGPEGSSPVSGAAWIETPLRVAPWLRPWRRQQVVAAIEHDPPTVMHAMGECTWSAAVEAAAALECPLTLDIWSAELLRRLPPARAVAKIAGYLVPTAPIADALRQKVEPELVSLVPVGTVVPRSPPAVMRSPADAVALAIIGSGRDFPAYRAMLTGLSRVVREFPQVQVCLELRGPYDHEIWRLARRLDLLGHLSAIGDATLHRALLTGCDILVLPERYGEVRPLIYQAMSHGMPTVAAADPYLDMLIDERTALLVDGQDPEEWARRLRRLLAEPDLARRLGTQARDLVRTSHRLQGQADALHTALAQVVSGGAHSFA